MNERDRLSKLVANFGEAMRQKLWARMTKLSGWDDTSDIEYQREAIAEKLLNCVESFKAGDNDQFVDIANLAAMLWNFKQLEEKEKQG